MDKKKNIMTKTNNKKKTQTKKKQIKKKSLRERIMKKLGIKSKKAFTLIELLAVIVILGLLMAIAIPSVTKYITESRKKTVISTIENYITAMINEVNDLTYIFTEANTIYAVPIECIALERGGTNPLGLWYQANDAYWAYVLVQYNDEISSYTYGFTFKDSAGYGLYPTAQSKLNASGKQIKTGLNLKRPETGKATNITDINNWNGFIVNDTTNLAVLEAESEGNIGNGKTTCTLQQKGDNYNQVEEEKSQNKNSFANLIKENNTIKTTKPRLTTTSEEANENGLYASTDTNGGTTYYFRGNVNNNVEFAGLTWKIIRINEDGTVRLILSQGINSDSYYKFNSSKDSYTNMYYSNSDVAKPTLDAWYTNTLSAYDSYIAEGDYYCEQAKVRLSDKYSSGSVTMDIYTSYTPNFKCVKDANGKGVVKARVGLITYDEIIHAGGYYNMSNATYYLSSSKYFWTMSPSGSVSSRARIWRSGVNNGRVFNQDVSSTSALRPVINLKTSVLVTVKDPSKTPGTTSNPYRVQ